MYRCELCIFEHGPEWLAAGSAPKSEEELAVHLESKHHMPTARPGETIEQCKERFLKAYPEALTLETCKCPDCRVIRLNRDLMRSTTQPRITARQLIYVADYNSGTSPFAPTYKPHLPSVDETRQHADDPRVS